MKKAVSILLMIVILLMCMVVTAQSDVTVTLDGNGIFFPNAKPFIDKQTRVLRLLLGDVKIKYYKNIDNKKLIWYY